MIVLPFSVSVSVDYDDESNWEIDGDFFNRHPLITREHFPIDCNGHRDVQFRLLGPDAEYMTGEALSEIKAHSLRRPNLAETRVFHRVLLEKWREKPVLSLCGVQHEQGGHPFIAYVQGEADRLNLFFNWMGFKRTPTGVILAIAE